VVSVEISTLKERKREGSYYRPIVQKLMVEKTGTFLFLNIS
jgi:hypothetical protein